MQFSDIFRILGNYLLYFALILCFPLGVSIYFEYVTPIALKDLLPPSSLAFFETLLLCIAIALLFRFLGRKAKKSIYRRESIALVVIIWLSTTTISAFPFYLSHTLSPIDSFFEAMSGLTTTGATMISAKAYDPLSREEIPLIVTDPNVPGKEYSYYGTISPVINPKDNTTLTGVEAVSRGILFWRSFLQWLGGMGIVVLFLTVLPALGIGGKFLYQTEMSGPVKESITPRIKETASRLWKIYVGLTIIEIILLMWTNENLPFFEAVCISLSNLSTGGFSLHSESIASYHNAATEWIVIFFMILGSINFAFYFYILRLKFYKIYAPEFFLFLFFILLGSSVVSFFLVGTPSAQLDFPLSVYTVPEAIRAGTFQAISAQTSTGFFTANYDNWPFPAQMFMLILMFIGGMSGATSGGIKTSRFYILYKILTHRIESLFRPESVRKLIVRGAEISSKASTMVLGFFCLIGFFCILGIVLMVLEGVDPETSLCLMASLLNNVGMAFRAAGPLDSINYLSPVSKLLAAFWMLLGRLEYYTIVLLFFPAFWRDK